MADKANTYISEKGHAPDKSEATGAGRGHCPHCEEHSRRIGAVEAALGIKAQPGVASEETAGRAGQIAAKRESMVEARRRH